MANLLLAVIYVAFISLGLPDAVLGAAWPTMGTDLNAPVSWEGGISMTISAGTIVSALLSDRMTLRFARARSLCIRGIDGVRFVRFLDRAELLDAAVVRDSLWIGSRRRRRRVEQLCRDPL